MPLTAALVVKGIHTKMEKKTVIKEEQIVQTKSNKLVSKSITVNATSPETVRRLLIDPTVIAENMTITTASGLKPLKKTIQQHPNKWSRTRKHYR